MKVAFFSTQSYDRDSFTEINSNYHHQIDFYEDRLSHHTAVLAAECPAVCLFINDTADTAVIDKLASGGTKLLALRSAGYDRVDLERAAELDIKVVRVPAYSPHAVAEHAVALILTLNRKLYRAYNRVRDDNFSLDGLLGFDLHDCTVGIVGTGKIGTVFAQIMAGFGCHLLGYDAYPHEGFKAIPKARYVDLPELWAKSDIISLHCPLLPETYHLINREAIARMKPGVMLINTSRGALVDTPAVIDGIKSRQIGYLGIDVYEQEDELFFQDMSDTVIQDDTFQLLQSFPNVVITAHQAFFTRNALEAIAKTTLSNISKFEQGQPLDNQVVYRPK